jgi:hypothetical protein
MKTSTPAKLTHVHDFDLHEGVDALSGVGTGDGNVFSAVRSTVVGSGRESDEEGVVRVDLSTVTI